MRNAARLNPLASVRASERGGARLAFLTLFGLMTAHGVLETARDALFLSSLPAARLPWVYLGIALAALGVTALERRVRPMAGNSLLALLSVGVVLSLASWLFVTRGGPWVFYVLYVWSGILATLMVVEFWSLLQDIFDVAQAKRLFALIGTGGVLGAIAGAALARVASEIVGAEELLVVAASVFGVACVPARLIARGRAARRSGSRPRWGPGLDRTAVRRDPYVLRLAALVLVSTVTLTLVDYLFKSAVASSVEPARLGSTFATVYMVLNLVSLVFQVYVVGRLTRSLGVSSVLAVLPIGLLVAAGGLLVSGGLAAALLLKGIDGALRHSLHRTSLEILYVPLGADVRARVKKLIDVIGQRGGQALASVGILAAIAVGAGEAVLAAAVVVLSGLWMWIAIWLKPFYLDLFRRTLREGLIESQIDLPKLDLASFESLLGALNSANDQDVIAAMDLLQEKGKIHLVQPYILYHPSSRVVVHALDLFSRARRTDFQPIADRLVGHLDSSVRAGVLRLKLSQGVDVETLREFLEDPAPRVRGTAVAGLLAAGDAEDPVTAEALSAIVDGSSNEGKIALLQGIIESPSPVCDGILVHLADDPDIVVRRETARAMRCTSSLTYLPKLIEMLELRELRTVVRETIERIGPVALPALEEALWDVTLPVRRRIHVPRTIAFFEPERAGEILLRRFASEENGAVRFKILRVLGFLRYHHPSLPLDETALRDVVDRTIEAAVKLLGWRLRLEEGARERPERRTPAHETLTSLLMHKEVHAIDRLFRLLDLVDAREDYRRIYRGLMQGDRRAAASSRELLENLLASPHRETVLALVDDVSDADRLAATRASVAPGELGYVDVLRSLLAQSGATVCGLVVYHVGELGLVELVPDIRSQETHPEDPNADVIADVLRRLEQVGSGGTR